MVNNLTITRYRDNITGNLEQSCLLLDNKLEMMEKNAQALTNNSQMMQIVKLEKLKPGDQNVYMVREFQKYLKTLFPEDLSQYAVILKNGYVFTSTGVILGREFFFDSARRYENMEYEEWIERSFFSKNRNLLPLQNIDMGNDSRKAITYCLPVGRYYMPEEADGSVQFFIEESFLREIFLPVLRLEESYVIVYAENEGVREPVCLLYGDKEKQLPAMDDIDMGTLQDNEGYVKLERGQEQGEEEAVYVKSASGKFIAAAYMPKELIINETKQIRVILFWLVGISLVIEIGLGIYFSLKYSTPIKNLIKNIYGILQPEGRHGMAEDKPVGEYDKLESGINLIIQQNYELQSELRKKETREMKDFYKRLFTGLFVSEEEVQLQLSELNINLNGTGYAAAAAEAGEEADKVREILRAADNQGICWVQIIESGLVAVLFSTQENSLGKPEEAAAKMGAYLEEATGHTYRIGVGRTYQKLTDIAFSYNQAVYCMHLSSEEKGEPIIVYDAAAQNRNILYYPAELEEKLINSTRHGELERIEEIFTLIYEENTVKRHLSGTMEKLLGANITATLLKVYSDVVPDEQIDSLLVKRYDLADIKKMLTGHKQLFLDICLELHKTRNGKQEDYRKQFETFIEDNYKDSQMSVKSAADIFGFSESYFSIVFKETTGEAFSTYLEKVRITYAKQLLEEDCVIEAVAERVGYNNSGTFRRAFKRATGIPPTAWKQNKPI